MDNIDTHEFAGFFATAEPDLRRALVARFGGELGREAAAEALTYGWTNWQRVQDMDNPVGYLYRVGERWAKKHRRQPRFGTARSPNPAESFEPGLQPALEQLSPRQRQVVVLTTGYGLTHSETAALLGISRSSVQSHAERGLQRLRTTLGATQ